jgi:hypothetical protein
MRVQERIMKDNLSRMHEKTNKITMQVSQLIEQQQKLISSKQKRTAKLDIKEVALLDAFKLDKSKTVSAPSVVHSITEKNGSNCEGKVPQIALPQEPLPDEIKVE